MRPTHPTSDSTGPPPALIILWGTSFVSNSLFKPLKVDHNMGAHLALGRGAGLWVTDICGSGTKSFIAPSRHLTIDAHEALTAELNHKEINGMVLHKDKAKTAHNQTRLHSNKERGCGRYPIQETLGIISGGGGGPEPQTQPRG